MAACPFRTGGFFCAGAGRQGAVRASMRTGRGNGGNVWVSLGNRCGKVGRMQGGVWWGMGGAQCRMSVQVGRMLRGNLWGGCRRCCARRGGETGMPCVNGGRSETGCKRGAETVGERTAAEGAVRLFDDDDIDQPDACPSVDLVAQGIPLVEELRTQDTRLELDVKHMIYQPET